MTKSKLAIASFILGIVSFIQLLGLEKALLAIIFGAVALRELSEVQELKGKNYAYAGIIFGSLYILILGIITIVKWPQIFELISKLK